MTILIDIDGVIFNTQEMLLSWLNSFHLLNYTIEDITSYDWFDKTFINPWEPMEFEEFWNDVEVNEQAVDYIIKWKHEGHTIKFVTASYYHHALSTKVNKLLDCFNGEFDDKDVIVCHNKSMIVGTLLIDDCFDNCDNFHSHSIIYKQPWNKEAKSKKEFINSDIILRTNDWQLIDDAVRLIFSKTLDFDSCKK